MAYKEHILMQKMPYVDGEGNTTTYDVIDLVDTFSIWGKEVPFVIAGDIKDVYTNDWHDEDGVEAYVPNELKIKSYNITLELACKSILGDGAASRYRIRDKIKSFINFLTGRDSSTNGIGAYFKMFSTYTGIGRQNVRLVSISDDATHYNEDKQEMVIMKFTFAVDDPVTDVTLTYTPEV